MKVLTVNLRDELYDQFSARAASDQCAMSELARRFVRQYTKSGEPDFVLVPTDVAMFLMAVAEKLPGGQVAAEGGPGPNDAGTEPISVGECQDLATNVWGMFRGASEKVTV